MLTYYIDNMYYNYYFPACQFIDTRINILSFIYLSIYNFYIN